MLVIEGLNLSQQKVSLRLLHVFAEKCKRKDGRAEEGC